MTRYSRKFFTRLRGVRVCGDAVLLDFWCGFTVIFIFSCGIAVLQNQAVCGIQKFSGNFNAVCGFHMLLCAVFIRISARFCGIRTPLTPPSNNFDNHFSLSYISLLFDDICTVFNPAIGESLLTSQFTFFIISIRLTSQKGVAVYTNQTQKLKEHITLSNLCNFQLFLSNTEGNICYQKLRNCWVAKKLLSHTFFVKFRVFKREFLRNHLVH